MIITMKKKILLKQLAGYGIPLILFICVSSVNAYAEGGASPIYLTQDPVTTEEPEKTEESNPKEDAKTPFTYDGYIKMFATLLVICITGFIASTCAAKKSQKDSNEK